ncbi:MAG: porin family protein [Prevotella sp.]|nr:porin family protein [Prevotella sp.]
MRASNHHTARRWLKVTSLSFVIFHLSFFICIQAQAQVRLGVKGGFQLANMQFNTDALRSSNRVGFSIGPTVKIGLPVPGISVDIAALYDQRDLKVQEQVFKQKSLLIQGDARCGAGIGDVLGIFIKAGPQFSFNVGDDIIHWVKDGDSKQFALQETMLSINLGVGVTFANHFEGAITYNIPISKTADFTWHQLSNELFDETWNHAKTRTNAWSVSVTYYF